MRDVMFEGESGIVVVARRYGMIREHNKSQGKLTLTNGSTIQGYTAEKPDRLRGPQHHGALCDELAAWRYDETWTNLKLGLRLGEVPRVIVTTTPRPTARIRALVKEDGTQITRGATNENRANLSEAALVELDRLYGGTRLGRQELLGEILDESEGALWTHKLFDSTRVDKIEERTVRRMVGVDPAVTVTETSDETGIIVASLGQSGHIYIEQDHSGKYAPDVWARKVAALEVDSVVAEVNQGGDMVRQVLKAAGVDVPIKSATATKGKAARAEPVAVQYERGMVHHVGTFPALEDQASAWVPGVGDSPDRVDALVWAVAGLQGQHAKPVISFGRPQTNPWQLR